MSRHIILAAAALSLAVPALAQTDYWIANRASSDIMRISEWGSVLERVATPTTLRSCTEAPDGKVWIVRFGSATMDIYDPNTASFSSAVAPSGSAYQMTFDAAGTAWVSSNGSDLHNFDANGIFIQTIALGVTSAAGITVDGLGNKWVAHRTTPATLTRVDAAGVVTNFPLSGVTSMLPIGPVADYRGFGQPSHIWVTGDNSSEIAEVDGATGATLNVYTVPFSQVAYPPTFDLNGRIWVSSFGNDNIVQLDQTNGNVLLALNLAPSNNAITTDNFGRIRTTSRVTFSGVGPPCEVRRFDPLTGALEIPTQLAFAGFSAIGSQSAMSTQFQYSLVVDQLGDIDGDGEVNWVEMIGGTSPTDAASNSAFRMESFGSTLNGSTPTFEVQSAGIWVAGFAPALGAPIAVPGISGSLLLDPVLIVATSAGIGNSSLPVAIPGTPALAGFEFFAQGASYDGVSFTFQNVTGMLVW
jgi:streptogramin lyase